MKNIIILVICSLASSINAQNRKLQAEPNHSTVGFNISIAGFSIVTGKFTDYEILLDWDEEEITATKIFAEIKVASINTGIGDRDAHLQSADFFDEEKYPTITFESDSILRINYAHFNAFGKLTMHGITKDFVLPFEIVKMDGNTIGIKSRTTLNRLDYGVGTAFKHTSLPDFLSDNIAIEIDFWTKKRK